MKTHTHSHRVHYTHLCLDSCWAHSKSPFFYISRTTHLVPTNGKFQLVVCTVYVCIVHLLIYACGRVLIFAIEDNADDHNNYEYIWKSQLKSAEQKNLLRKNLKLKKKFDYIASLCKATITIKNIKNDWMSVSLACNVNAKLLLLPPLPPLVFVFVLYCYR